MTPRAMRALQTGNRRWLAGAAAVFIIVLVFDLLHGFSIMDESWFLQVVRRSTSGAALYRDIFYGAGPLTVYITALPALILGSQILVVKAVSALCFTATALVMTKICLRLPVAIHPPLLILALLALMPPWLPGGGVPYSPLAILLLTASLGVMLRWAFMEKIHPRRMGPSAAERRILAAGGALAGLALATKQDIGAYCLVLLVITVAGISLLDRSPWKLILARLRVTTAVSLGTLLVMLLPVVITGGAGNYIDFGFTNKSTYVQYGHLSYWSGVDELGHLLVSASTMPSWSDTYNLFLYLIPLLVFPALVLAWLLSPKERRRTTIITAYAGTGFISTFPRSDTVHLAYAVPGLILGAIWAWHLLGGRLPVRARITARAALWSWLLLGLIIVAGASNLPLGGNTAFAFSHFGGAVIGGDDAAALKTRVAAVRAAASDGQPMFILSPDAGFLYLASDQSDPTPFDYPLVTAFGKHGEEDVISAIASGRIPKVMLDISSSNDPLHAAKLENYVIRNMTPEPPVAGFVLYRHTPGQ